MSEPDSSDFLCFRWSQREADSDQTPSFAETTRAQNMGSSERT